jgi:hypothetical protein
MSLVCLQLPAFLCRFYNPILNMRSSGFARRSIHVGFAVDKVALGQDFSQVLRFYLVNIIPLWFSNHIHHLGDDQ